MRPAPFLAFLSLLAIAALLLTTAACSSQQSEQARLAPDTATITQDTTFSGTLLQILRQQQRFGIFTTLIDSAGLAPALRSSKPHTVFAATNAGLDQLPEGLVEELLLPQNRDRLVSILGYHIHEGKLTPNDVQGADSISTLTHRALPVTLEGGHVMIGEATMSEQSITGRNGRIYVIDALVLPPPGTGAVDLPNDTGTTDSESPDDAPNDASGSSNDDTNNEGNETNT